MLKGAEVIFGYRAPDPSFFEKLLHGSGQKISHLEYQQYRTPQCKALRNRNRVSSIAS